MFSGDNGSSFSGNSAVGRLFDQTMGGKLRGFKRGMYEGGLREYFYWELHEGKPIQAIRFGDWKEVLNGPANPLELYDLKTDPGETKNLAAAKPELVSKAEALMKNAHVDDPNWPMTADKSKTAPKTKPRKPE